MVLQLSTADNKKYSFRNFSIKIKFEKGAKIRIRNTLQHLLELLILERDDSELDFLMPKLPFMKEVEEGVYHASAPVICGTFPFAKGFDASVEEKNHIDNEIIMDMTYYGCGDIDEVRGLLEKLEYMGEEREKGYGKIKNITIEETDKDLSLTCKAQHDEDKLFELADEDMMGKNSSGQTNRIIINKLIF